MAEFNDVVDHTKIIWMKIFNNILLHMWNNYVQNQLYDFQLLHFLKLWDRVKFTKIFIIFLSNFTFSELKKKSFKFGWRLQKKFNIVSLP